MIMIKVHVSGLMICGMKSSVLEAPDTQVLCSTELEREKREKFSGILCIFFFHGQNSSISENNLAFVRTPMREAAFFTLSMKWEVVWEKVRERKRRCCSGFLFHGKFFEKFVKSKCYVPSFKWHSTIVCSRKR